MKQIKLYGLGGQGVVTAGKILATAVAIYEGKYAQTIPAYGHERRGAPVYTDLILDDEPILTKSFVYQPDYVVIFDLSVIEKGVNVMEGVHKNTCFVVNSHEEPINYPFSKGYGGVLYADATRIALNNINRDIPNSSMVGAFAATGAVGIDSVASALMQLFNEKVGGNNVEAARECYSAIRRL